MSSRKEFRAETDEMMRFLPEFDYMLLSPVINLQLLANVFIEFHIVLILGIS